MPNGVQVGAKLAAKSDPLLHVLSKLILDRILEPLGVDFGCVLESKLSSERVINLRKLKCSKCYYLRYETSFFHVPRGPKIDEKSVPRRTQHRTKIGKQFWNRFGSQVEAKWMPRSLQKPIVLCKDLCTPEQVMELTCNPPATCNNSQQLAGTRGRSDLKTINPTRHMIRSS